MAGAILKLRNGISNDSLLKLHELIKDSLYFDEDRLLFFKLDGRIATISEKEISLADTLEESEVRRVMEKIGELYRTAERSSRE